MTGNVLWLFITMLRVGLQLMIVVLSDHTHLHVLCCFMQSLCYSFCVISSKATISLKKKESLVVVFSFFPLCVWDCFLFLSHDFASGSNITPCAIQSIYHNCPNLHLTGPGLSLYDKPDLIFH